MNFGQMKEAFCSYTGITDDVDNAELALWLNEAQLDLSWELSAIGSQQVEGSVGTVFTPPDTWLTVIGGSGTYRVTPDGNIILEEDGPLTLYYRQLPEEFTGADSGETSGLHQALHYLLPIYAASRYWDKEAEGDGEEIAQANRWLSYYYQGKNLAKSRLFGMNEPMTAWEIRG